MNEQLPPLADDEDFKSMMAGMREDAVGIVDALPGLWGDEHEGEEFQILSVLEAEDEEDEDEWEEGTGVLMRWLQVAVTDAADEGMSWSSRVPRILHAAFSNLIGAELERRGRHVITPDSEVVGDEQN